MANPSSQLAWTCALAQVLHDCPSAAGRQLLAAHPTAAAIADASGVHVNASWQAEFGSETTLPPDIADACAPLAGGASSVDVSNVTVVGTRIHHVALHAVPLRDRAGTSCGLIVACCDVTDDVVQRDLGVSPETLVWGGLLEGAADYFSARWRASRIVPAISWLDAFHPDDLVRCTLAFSEAQRVRVSSPFEARIRGVDGHDRWYRVLFVSRADGSWFGTAADIHEANLAEERSELLAVARAARADAELANRLKDEFLAMVSHELRGPIATLLLWERVLRDGATDVSSRAQALDAIHHSAVAQSRLVGDLLDLSRAVTGKLYIDVRRVDLHKLVREALDAVRPAAAAKALELRSFWLGTPAEIEGDATRLVQVLDNVLSNAIKFTPHGGTVSISLQQRETDTIEVVISDNGQGIAAELLPHIFEPFTQSDDVLTRQKGGLGLGLAVAHTIVTLHGGTLTAASPGRGLGTTVSISLPAAITQRATLAPPTPRAATLAGLHVLIVDDDTRVCGAIALLLGRAGAIVTTASSAAEGRSALASARTDVIICDIAMPGEDGYAFVRSVRDTDTVTPVIALTAFATDTYATRALESGFNRHLAKPIHIERLIDCINELHHARVASQIT